MATARDWCVTINHNMAGAGDLDPGRLVKEHPNLKYAVWQLERAPSTGQLHTQMFLRFVRPVRMAYVKKFLDRNDAHCEARKGTAEQAADYCKKEDSRVDGPWEIGVFDAQGQRRDLEALFACAKSGMALREAAEEVGAWAFTYARAYDRALDEYQQARWEEMDEMGSVDEMPGFEPPVVNVIYGDSGTGKSQWVYRSARRIAKERGWKIYRKMPGEWWQGYTGQEVVIIDDFYGSIRWGTLLQLLDGYHGIRVEVKGGSVPWDAKVVYITSNKHPRDWYSSISDPTPLARRITDLWEVRKLPDWVPSEPTKRVNRVLELWDGENAAQLFIQAQHEADARVQGRAGAALPPSEEGACTQEL